MATLPDSGAVDAALVAVLEQDTALQALCPGGVHFGTAPQESDRPLIFTLEGHAVEPMFGGVAWEEFVYAVVAIMPTPDNTAALQAAARLRALLDDTLGPTGIAPAGWSVMLARYRRYTREVEVDPQNYDGRWQHRGGQFTIRVQPLPMDTVT